MTKEYKTFMRHAKKITKSAAAGNRPVLKGVKHFEDGSLAVTDSHRLYLIKDMHDKGDTNITPDGQELEGNYPEIHRLIPDRGVGNITMTINVDEMLKGADIILTANTAADVDNAPMHWDGDILYMDVPETIAARYELPEDHTLETIESFSSNAKYWVDALKLFKAFKYTEVVLEITNRIRPFTLTSPDGKLLALLMPIRTF